VVAEKSHIQNWKDEFLKWGLNEMDVTIICYASLHKFRNEKVDILVLDEGHHAFTEKRKDILSSLSADYVFMLSATLSSQKVSELEEIYGKFITSTVTLREAIKKDILPDPKVNIIEMELDNTTPNQEIHYLKGRNLPVITWEERSKYIYKKIPCIIKCTERQKYIYLTSDMEYWKERFQRSGNPFHQNRWVNLGSQRKRFLGELKTEKVKSLISSFKKNKRFICFCASVTQAEELDKKMTISSRKSSKFNQATIDAFNKKAINRLYAVGMATEGLNLTDIQAGIIVQLDGKERLFIQKAGRVLRSDYPIIYIIYYKNTQDEVYLKQALENIDSEFIKYWK
jgi:superfamily II DNA or RNA helicase